MTYKMWFDQNAAKYKDDIAGMYKQLCSDMGCNKDCAYHAYSRWKKSSGIKTTPVEKPLPKSPSGLGALGELFGKSNRQNRRAKKLHAAVDAIIAGELKKRSWMYDRDMQTAAGVSRDDWTYIRQDYEDLLLTATDDNSRRVTIWVHPSCRDEALDLINS